MIAFASCVADSSVFATRCLPGLRLAGEPSMQFAELSTTTSILEVYNEALDHFATVEELEALVLLHEDTELLDPDFGAIVRRTLSDPAVAVIGAIGARGVTSLAWWEGEMVGRIVETRGSIDRGCDEPAVDAVDGLLMVLSPWAVRNLRFDDATYAGFHAYDVDFCFAARAAGRKVVVADLSVVHHTKGGYGDQQAWLRSDARFRAKWGLPPREAAGRLAA